MNNNQEQRTYSFQRNASLEHLLAIINNALACSEESLKNTLISDPHPLIFIMGPLRSGTTLFMQWLASTRLVAYPTNLLSRFFGAPLTGAYIQLLLTDQRYNFRNEILDFNTSINFSSENGKTRGALSPNEFWYFWRRFLPFGEIDWLPDDELIKVVDYKKLANELIDLTRVFEKPFAMKGMILNYNIPFLDSLFEKALFVQIKRDLFTNVASILEARKKQMGSETRWYSFKIPEYPQIKSLEPIEQAVGQVYYINKAVDEGINKLANERKLIVKYEDFCNDPVTVFSQLCEKLNISYQKYSGPDAFQETRKLEESAEKAIKKALTHFSDKFLV